MKFYPYIDTNNKFRLEINDKVIGRCIGVLINEGKPENQAAAICNSMWDENKMSAYEKVLKDLKKYEDS